MIFSAPQEPIKNRAEFFSRELEAIADALKEKLPLLRGKSILLTGATGFFGKWLTSSLAHLSTSAGLDLKIFAISRSSRAFLATFPYLAADAPIQWIDANLANRDELAAALPADFRCDFIIHAATPATLGVYESTPVDAYRTMIAGTENILEIARTHGARFLFTSSGAVYGKQPSSITHVTEDFLGAPAAHDYRSVYGEGKRINETLCAAYGAQYGLSYAIARCFAFVGPFLPLDEHFAVGNFMGDCLHGRRITIQGDGTPFRSYLYGTDLVIGLISLLLSERKGAVYNLGSDEDVCIADLAQYCVDGFRAAAPQSPAPEIRVLTPKSGQPPARYVPSIDQLKRDLGFRVRVPLREAIERTLQWHLCS